MKRDYDADFKPEYSDYDDPSESPRSNWLQFLACIAMAALGYFAEHTSSRRTTDCCIMGIGVLIVSLLVPTIRRGTIDLGRVAGGGGAKRGIGVYRRSADPLGFWTLIALGGIVAGVVCFGALGDLLGVWHLS